MSRFTELETYIAVVETGSLSAAAARLGIAVSAVSRRIGELETRLGVRLANRSTRGMSPTSLGESYYQRSVRLLADLAENDASVVGDCAAFSGELRVAAPLSFGIRHLGAALNRFARELPALNLHVDFSDRRVDLVEEGFDLAVRIGKLEDSSLVARQLFKVRHVVAASPAYWDLHGRPEKPDDLKNLTALVYRNGSQPHHWQYQTPDGQSGELQLQTRYTATNGDVLIEAAIGALGLTIQPTFIAHKAIASGELEPVLLDVDWGEMACYAVFPQGRPLPSYARRFVDFLVNEFPEPTSWDKGVFVPEVVENKYAE
ncbi:MAG: LysR family transcriptional regulator [Granulosicoccus sp.]